ncbi:MAG: hypothetical protein SXA11_15135 [Cyanobacteriota bacterium]|nr:hypothetical protein [Cyanobacteriota bacterium]
MSIASCDSLPFLGGGGGGEEEATPEASPSPTAETPASPTPTPTPFASPDVPQKAPGAPALIQSSNPDERVSRLEQEVGGRGQTQTSTPPTTPGLPPGSNPFSLDIPIPDPSSEANGENGTAGGDAGPLVVTQLPSQRVPQIPTLPEIVSPPQLDGPQSPSLSNGGGTPREIGQGTPRQIDQGTTRQIGQRTPREIGPPRGGTTGSLIPDLASGQVPELPKLGELSRPPQVGGTRLVGDVPPIRLSPLAESVINEFRTFQQILSENTTYSDYVKDLTIIGEQFEPEEEEATREDRRNSVRRQLLLTNEKLYRRLEKVLQEYVFALRLWNTYYSQSNDPDTVRCSSIPAIERAIKIYQAPTVRRGQLLCASRIALLGSIWQRAENILEAALRDRDFNAPSLADIPSLPDAGEPKTLTQLPVVPPFEAPSQPRSIGLGPGPVEPIPEIPPIAVDPRVLPGLPELPVQDPPPRDPSARQPEPVAGGGEPAPAPPPPPPSTDLAEGVKVTGVVEVGSEKQIIIQAPNEATSRYVKVGQRVAGGKVLVKRVDFENGEAIVILEQNDVEIRKIIGEEPAVE